MNKDQVEGKLKDAGGRVERQVGEWTGDTEKQVNGTVKQAEGKAQNAWGNVKEAGKKAADNAKKADDQPVDVEEEKQAPSTRRKAG